MLLPQALSLLSTFRTWWLLLLLYCFTQQNLHTHSAENILIFLQAGHQCKYSVSSGTIHRYHIHFCICVAFPYSELCRLYLNSQHCYITLTHQMSIFTIVLKAWVDKFLVSCWHLPVPYVTVIRVPSGDCIYRYCLRRLFRASVTLEVSAYPFGLQTIFPISWLGGHVVQFLV